jgi:hypothetical protein
VQAETERFAHITVTDPLGRFVTGLEQERFQVVESGVQRRIIAFSDTESPISLAIVSERQLVVGDLGLDDVLIQTRSLAEALSQLSASKNPRKAVLLTNLAGYGADTGGHSGRSDQLGTRAAGSD